MGVVRIRATVRAPVVMTEELHLDGLLAAAHPVCRGQAIDRATPASALLEPPLPVFAQTTAVGRVYCCSSAILPSSARVTSDHAVRRRDGEDIRQLAGKVHLGLGPGKNRMRRLPIVVTPSIEWLAIGDRRQILHLVRRIAFLGSWRSAGYGQVGEWSAEYVTDRPGSAVLEDEGLALRHLPAEWVTWSARTTVGPVRAPYWHPARQTDAMVPSGTPCSLVPRLKEILNAAAEPAALRAHEDRHLARRLARRTHPDTPVPDNPG